MLLLNLISCMNLMGKPINTHVIINPCLLVSPKLYMLKNLLFFCKGKTFFLKILCRFKLIFTKKLLKEKLGDK